MVEYSGRQERLYLVKGDFDDSDIFVDTKGLAQHQYDGVRFLYRQFKKNKPGVILNDPSGYGKRVQTVIFLNAISPVLSLPTLIVCAEGTENEWMHQFHKWTNIGSDVSVQQGYEFSKSMGLIGNFSQLSVLSRREWGIIVVDDTNVSRDALRAGICARYKIWLTSIDMKKNLNTFSLIYKWFNPRAKFPVEDFQITMKTPSIILTKSTRLDAFMEDIVLRRKGVSLPLGKPDHAQNPPKVSRKNKDATGKKIKRSKPLSSHEHDTSGESEETVPKLVEKRLMSKDREARGSKEIVDNYVVKISNEGPIKIEIDYISDLTPPDDISDHDNEDRPLNNNEVQDKLDENVVLVVDDDDSDEVPKSDSVTKSNLKDGSSTISYSDSIISRNRIIKYDSDSPDSEDEVAIDEIPVKKRKTSNEIDLIINDKINEVAASEDLFSTDIISNENKVNSHEKKSDVVETAPGSSSNEGEDEIKSKVHQNKVGNGNNVSENNKTDPKLDGIEMKLKRMEELAVKKYKGSFLDSIF